MPRLSALISSALPMLALSLHAAGEPPVFERDIHPILKANCYHCHGEEDELKGGLDLRLVKTMRQGGESGPAIEAGSRAKSHLFELISEGKMPPKKEKGLKPEEIAKIGEWLDAGARTLVAEPESSPKPGEFFISPAERQHWSFQPIRKPPVPAIETGSVNPIDAFVAAKLAEKGLSFSEEADKITLIRRASFDLLGLPPTPDEVKAYLSDSAPGAWERVVDRLLESPHYGERWGRHWLDVAGYAD
ncbi:MAG: DUF1549 domain-containing protein, partial [Verrucomicrobiae bacterium]|nr:DUF1549 domain-containing protein [Verrucomicrobiae bacterium]